MRRFLWIVPLLCLTFPHWACADSIPVINANITLATFKMFPNDGSGDNIYFTLVGPHTLIEGMGGTACFDWCSGPIPAGTSVAIGQIWIGPFFTTIINGKSYDAMSELSLCCFFPDSGGFLSGSVSGFVGTGDTYAELNLTLPGGGGWTLNFVPVDGGFQFVNGQLIAGSPVSQTPEPATISLLALGLAGIAGASRRKQLTG